MSYVTPPVPTEEDEEWERLDYEFKRKNRQRIVREAVASAQEFIEGLAPAEIGIFTLRKAFEEGYIEASIRSNKTLRGNDGKDA